VVPKGTTVLDAARIGGIAIHASCGGHGDCEKCVIHVVQNDCFETAQNASDCENICSSPEMFTIKNCSENKLPANYIQSCRSTDLLNLACRTKILFPMVVMIDVDDFQGNTLNTPDHKISFVNDDLPTKIHLFVSHRKGKCTDVCKADKFQSVWDIFLNTFYKSENDSHSNITPSIGILHDLSINVAEGRQKFYVGIDNHTPLWLLPDTKKPLGLAIDLGSTKIAGYLLDITTGEILKSLEVLNPQCGWGHDILSRITATMNESNALKDMHKITVNTINELGKKLCHECSKVGNTAFGVEQITDCVIVGNTVMLNIFLNIDISGLGQAPFTPVYKHALNFSIKESNLSFHTSGRVYSPPIISGFIGSDHISAILNSGVLKSHKTSLLVDIGTNTEISLIVNGKVHTCSAASGPAFEGTHISCGMSATAGAIHSMDFIDGKFYFKTVGRIPAIGICGSGVCDALACLRKSNIITRNGTLDVNHSMVRHGSHGPEVVLVPSANTGHGNDIILTRRDIGNIQLAKAAIRSGIELLLRSSTCDADNVESVLIAGSFGTHLNIESARAIGLFPEFRNATFRQIGNAAGDGAVQMLMSRNMRELASSLAQSVIHHELATDPTFASTFARATILP
jgi:uncharacterized 2Fe-2S/4Fe-4S cluster protein (DUF4445 family)